MKTRDKVIIGVLGACLAVAAGIWMEVWTCRRMRAAVEQALEMNSTFQPFTSDTIYLNGDSSDAVTLRRAVAYYDHPLRHFLSLHSSFFIHHSSLTKSLYALGCVYRDLHEAPIAIITWEDAAADDCDYATLYRVYGQMTDIYRDQLLPEKQLEVQKRMSYYALLAGDTLISLRGQLLCNSAYYALGDTAAIFANSESVRQQFLQLGFTQEAAKVYPTPIHVAVEVGQYGRARKMMDEYEQQSALFGADGFIKDSTRAQYHSYKGHYYLGIHEIDSAERQFRYLLPIHNVRFDAYRGLIAVYREKGNIDSVQKYSSLFEAQAIDAMNSSKNTAIIQAEGMYDYSRQQQIAQAEEKEAAQWKNALLIAVIFIIASIIILLYYYKKKKLQQELKDLEYNRLEDNYNVALEQLEEAQTDVALLQQELTHNDTIKQLLRRKETQVLELKELVNDLSNRLKYSPRHELQKDSKESEIVGRLHMICKAHFEEKGKEIKSIPARKASEYEWELLTRHTRISQPKFYLFLNEQKLSDLEFKVCLLVRFGFKNPEIATLTGSNNQSISNVRKRLAQTLFGLNSAYELDSHLIEL